MSFVCFLAMSLVSQTRVKVSERVAWWVIRGCLCFLNGSSILALNMREREGRCLFFFDKKKVGVVLREAKACLISFSNLTFELIPKRI